MEKANTHGTAETTAVVIARVSILLQVDAQAPRHRGAPKLHPALPSGNDLGRSDLQDLAGARDRDRPRLHRLWDLAHEVDVQECPSSNCLGQSAVFGTEALARLGLRLGGFQLMLQSSQRPLPPGNHTG
jgi:hypothetical protein